MLDKILFTFSFQLAATSSKQICFDAIGTFEIIF